MADALGVFLVVEDSIVRRSLRELVQSDQELQLVGQAAGVSQALTRMPSSGPDVALVDDRLPDGNGFDLCRELRSLLPMLQCIIFASFGSAEVMLNAIQAGASGCLIRNARGVETLAAIKDAAAGEVLLDTGIATAWLANRVREDFLDVASVLTEPEIELLGLLAAGHTGSQIVDRMSLDDGAFRGYLWTLMAKAQASGDGGRSLR
jgi:two-component system response regulator DevR